MVLVSLKLVVRLYDVVYLSYWTQQHLDPRGATNHESSAVKCRGKDLLMNEPFLDLVFEMHRVCLRVLRVEGQGLAKRKER